MNHTSSNQTLILPYHFQNTKMKMPPFLHSFPPRSFFFCCFLLLPLLLLLLLLVAPSSSSSSGAPNDKVTMSLYYESLCPYCADFIVNHLVRLFRTGLISNVNLRMIPWGNAWIAPDGTVICHVTSLPFSMLFTLFSVFLLES
ncbi:GILT protein [Spatholobus suberectus]|nr:GILT protein [Spatholobus suberectus]